MLKLLGSVFIICAFGIWGFSKSESLKRRSDALLRIISSLFLLESEVAYGKKGVRDALLSIGLSENLPLFTAISENVGIMPMQEVFKTALSEYNMGLSSSDKRTLAEFSQSLGDLDTSSQIKSILHTKELLKVAQNEAYEEYRKYSRLYRSMGILLGLLFSLILF